MDGFLANIVKYALFATNFLVFIMGCVVLGVGIYALVDGQALMDLVNTQTDVTLTVFTSAAYILIAVSVLVVIVSFFGCCGAIKENRCMLGTYFTVILLMFITLIVGSVIGYATSIDKVEEAIEKTMPKFKDNPDNANDEEKAITAAWNTVQKDYACCGSSFNNTYNSWTKSGAYPVNDFKVPETCCLKEQVGENNIQKCRKDPHSYNLTGCFDKFDDLIEGNKKSVLAVGVTIVVIMFLNMLFAFAMCTMVD